MISEVKTLSFDDPIFASHFPDKPIYPGVHVCRRMQEFCELVLAQQFSHRVYLREVQQLRFRKPLLPGSSFLVEVESVDKDSESKLLTASVQVRSHPDQTVIANGRLLFSDQQLEDIQSPDHSEDQTQLAIDFKTVKSFIPHGPHIRSIDGVKSRHFSEKAQALIDQGRHYDITFPDLEGSWVKSVFNLHHDFHLVEQGYWPSVYHAEAVAQCGAFMIYGLQPPSTQMDMTLLSFSAQWLRRVKAPSVVHAYAELTQSRGSSTKGYMNFFNGLVTCDGIDVATFRYNAMATYR